MAAGRAVTAAFSRVRGENDLGQSEEVAEISRGAFSIGFGMPRSTATAAAALPRAEAAPKPRTAASGTPNRARQPRALSPIARTPREDLLDLANCPDAAASKPLISITQIRRSAVNVSLPSASLLGASTTIALTDETVSYTHLTLPTTPYV